MRKTILFLGILLLFVLEIMRVYWIMPFPGSQRSNSISFAYWLGSNIFWIRILLLAIIAYPIFVAFRKNRRWKKVALGLVMYVVVFYFVNYRMEADKMFYQPRVKSFLAAGPSSVDSGKLVIGVTVNGEAGAYPIEIIGYHHQVRDIVGGKPIMVTYCTVCRTGRVFEPIVNGKAEEFRLVGMDHFNAMFEDATTKSWWQQATGEAITGPLKGTRLPEIPSQQMTIASWVSLHPDTKILQPDTNFRKQYEDLAGYDNGKIKGGLEHRDTASWQFKSWVVGVVANKAEKAYDWNKLVRVRLIQDSLGNIPVLLVLGKDTTSFYSFNRRIGELSLSFIKTDSPDILKDEQTGSIWSITGEAIDGQLKGQKLQPLQSYQEFWHSWKQFHPNTLADEQMKSGNGIWRSI